MYVYIHTHTHTHTHNTRTRPCNSHTRIFNRSERGRSKRRCVSSKIARHAHLKVMMKMPMAHTVAMTETQAALRTCAFQVCECVCVMRHVCVYGCSVAIQRLRQLCDPAYSRYVNVYVCTHYDKTCMCMDADSPHGGNDRDSGSFANLRIPGM